MPTIQSKVAKQPSQAQDKIIYQTSQVTKQIQQANQVAGQT